MSIIRDIFTGPDNQTIEVAHVLWVLGVVVFMIVVLISVLKSGAYPSNFGMDFAAIHGAGAAGAFARAKADQTMDK